MIDCMIVFVSFFFTLMDNLVKSIYLFSHIFAMKKGYEHSLSTSSNPGPCTNRKPRSRMKLFVYC